MREVIIAGAARTPMGGLMGALAGAAAPELGAAAIRAALEGAGGAAPDEVVMGCVLPAGQGQAPARQAGFGAGLGEEVPATTLNKMCGSGMAAMMGAWDRLALGGAEAIVAGGMESMSNAPYLLPKMRGGARMGHGQVVDSMFLDGLEDAYEPGRLMGTYAEDCAEAFQFTRAAQDEYALSSLERALEAQRTGAFAAEIAPVDGARAARRSAIVAEDEQPALARGPTEDPHFSSPPFARTAPSRRPTASSISDGAAALVMASARGGGGAGDAGARAGDGPRLPRPGARALHHRAGAGGAQAPRSARLDGRGRGSVGGQRGLRGGADGLHARDGRAARAPQRPWRGLRAGPPHRRLRRAHRGDAAARAGGAGSASRGVAAICIGGGEGTAIAIERP